MTSIMVTKQDIQVDRVFTRGDADSFRVMKIEKHPTLGTLVHSRLVRKEDDYQPREKHSEWSYCDSLEDFVNFLNND